MLAALRPHLGSLQALTQAQLPALVAGGRAGFASGRDDSSAAASSSSAPAAPAAAAAEADQPLKAQPAASSSRSAEEEWTEVIDEKSGQPYYWNQKTGETTELGEPRPTTRFRDSNWEQEAAGSSGPFQEGWREPPGRDFTYWYSFMGVAIGVAAGWCTQYMH